MSSVLAIPADQSSRLIERRPHIPRVAIVGTGFVGSTTAYAMLMSGLNAEVVLIDRDPRRAEGHVHDLRDAEVFSHNTRIFGGEPGDCCSADVTMITTGVSQAGLQSRLDGLKETANIVHALVRDVAEHNPRGILLIASNPVDVLTYAAWKWSGLSANRVIGSGTSLDTARFRAGWPRDMESLPTACMPTSLENMETADSRVVISTRGGSAASGILPPIGTAVRRECTCEYRY